MCPLCARGVRLQHGQDPNAAFEAHAAPGGGCDPSHYAKVHSKPRCPVARCQERLSLINTYACKSCGLRICLKHRLPDDHACAGAKGRGCRGLSCMVDRCPHLRWAKGRAIGGACGLYPYQG